MIKILRIATINSIILSAPLGIKEYFVPDVVMEDLDMFLLIVGIAAIFGKDFLLSITPRKMKNVRFK